MFVELRHKELNGEYMKYIINVNEISWIKLQYDKQKKLIYMIWLKSNSILDFYEDEIQPLLDYLKENNLMINTNT